MPALNIGELNNTRVSIIPEIFKKVIDETAADFLSRNFIYTFTDESLVCHQETYRRKVEYLS